MTSSSDTRIEAIHAWEALDSRGTPTVACRVTLACGATGRAIVPSGKSTGRHEVPEMRDGGERYDGRGVRRAVASVETRLRQAVLGRDATDIAATDAALASELSAGHDPVGSNATLAVSVAAALAAAAGMDVPLWRFLRPEAGPVLPMPMVQLIGGGAHAGGAIDIQDVLALPVGATTFADAVERVARVRSCLQRLLSRDERFLGLVGDEGGWAPRFPSNRAALETVAQAIGDAGYGPTEVAIGIDVAANQLMTDDGRFILRRDGRDLDREAWMEELVQWTRDLPLISIEDPLGEDDWEGWAELHARLPGIQIIGDDLFATDRMRVERGIDQRAASAVLVKPNQCGTLSAAHRALQTAQAAGLGVVVSARSGDSEDHWLADLAIGWGADQIKVGALLRAERTAKWNRLLEIEADRQSGATYQGWALARG